MKKEFNITGVCYPQFHYMMSNKGKLGEIMEMVERGKYFTINRPRQFGKTTSLFFLEETLGKPGEYLPIKMNFQGVDAQWHRSDEAFAQMFWDQLQKALKFKHPAAYSFIKESEARVINMDTLSELITELVYLLKKKPVLLIDEVDSSSNFDPFLSFLGMLRTKYLDRLSPQNATFHSIVLAGVHDIKTLKYKVRSDKSAQHNSPWNIAVDFEVDMSFNPKEIAPMLEEYSAEEGVEMDIPAIAERLHYHTAGYPFLVSKLCKNIAEKILPERKDGQWTVEDVDQAVLLLLNENNTNFDSLIKNMENSRDLYELVFGILIQGKHFTFNPHNPVIHLGVMYGVLRRNGSVKIHNRVYEQLIYNYMSSKMETALSREDEGTPLAAILPGNKLDMEMLLLKFQQFMKEQYRTKDRAFLERESRLVFLSYLSPVLNGGGHTFVEAQTSEEKRLDVVVTYFENKYIVELKRWYGSQYHKKGLDQLSDYLTLNGLEKGYLVIFDNRKKKSWKSETVQYKGKEIFVVWV